MYKKIVAIAGTRTALDIMKQIHHGLPNHPREEFFPRIGKIEFEGPGTDNSLAYKFYRPDRVLLDGETTMGDVLKFSACAWHHFSGQGADMFGPGTLVRSWLEKGNPFDIARAKAEAMMEFLYKVGVDYYCFHDFDLIAEGGSRRESTSRLQYIVDYYKTLQEAYGKKCLWGTQNMFSNPRYVRGAATSPDFRVLAYAAAQTKDAIDATIALGGLGHVFWGGREGYAFFDNTDMELELQNLGRFLKMARDYARSQGFKGKFFIEPKPREPMTHQYDYDAATTIGFIRQNGLQDDFMLNIEANHATLAGHTFEHELEIARINGMLGSVDLNTGDPLLGWDTDHFDINTQKLINPMLVVLENNGLAGGLNFDAKLRRESTDLKDLFHAFIGSMEAAALALLIADRLLHDPVYQQLTRGAYSSFDTSDGWRFRAHDFKLEGLSQIANDLGSDPKPESGHEEEIKRRVELIKNEVIAEEMGFSPY